MAKKKLTRKEQIASNPIVKQYFTERRKLIRNVKSLEQRGYDVSKITVPEIPKTISPASVRKIMGINESRYKKASHEVSQIVRDKKGNEKLVTKNVSGTQYRKQEQSIAGQKASATKKENIYKDKRERVSRRITGSEIEERNPDLSYTYNMYKEKPSEEPEVEGETLEGEVEALYDYLDSTPSEYYSGEYAMNPESGEIKPASEISEEDRRKGIWVTMLSDKTAREIVDKALNDLDVMIQYQGTSRDSKSKIENTKLNAENIKRFIMDKLDTEPDKAVTVLRNMMDKNGFHTVDYMYSKGGYEKFLAYYNAAFEMGFDEVED